MSGMSIVVQVVCEDVVTVDADVLGLAIAQDLYGASRGVFAHLPALQKNVELPKPGAVVWLDTAGVLAARRVACVGVPTLRNFDYAQIREYGRLLLAILARSGKQVNHLSVVINGPGYGLDEIEAFESLLGGIVEAIGSGTFPPELQKISIVERSTGRAARLSAALASLLPDGRIQTGARGPLLSLTEGAQKTLRSVGYVSAAKPRVFVAMPFAPEMDDIFHFGIQGATNAAGMLCERADIANFTGDVLGWVTARIATANFVIADLTDANPNVYLEVGYAWGRGIRTVLIGKSGTSLKFDTQGQRCLFYTSIRHLEGLLGQELKALAASH
jgi:hypothetical protein